MWNLLRHDLTQALRSLRRNRKFAMLVVAILSVGMGPNTAIFSLIDRVLLRPFPYPDLDRLVRIQTLGPDNSGNGISAGQLEHIQRHGKSFEQVAVWRWREFTLTGVNDPESLVGLQVSEGLFPLLGVAPSLGRSFTPSDYEPSAPPVTILSDRFWRKHFHAHPGIIGRSILLDGVAYTVVGVMGPDFYIHRPLFPLWVPFRPSSPEHHKRRFETIARLRPCVSLEEAQQELNAIAHLAPPDPDTGAPWKGIVGAFLDEYTQPYRKSLLLLLAAVGIVLLIACSNAANLILVRNSGRQREFSVRACLGASRLQLFRQLLAEMLLLNLCAGFVGLAFAHGLIRAIPLLFAGRLPVPQIAGAAINGWVLAAAGGLVLLTTVLSALAPCVSLFREDLSSGLSSSSRSVSASRGVRRTRWLLISVEVALSVVLLVGAGLMLRSLMRLLDAKLGFDTTQVLTAQVTAPAQLTTTEQLAAYYRRLLSEVQSLPGVHTAGVVTILPLGGMIGTTPLTAEGCRDERLSAGRSSTDDVHMRSISPDYFSAMGIRLIRGRAFTEADTGSSPGVAIINKELAQRCWPGEDPIGKRVLRAPNPKDPQSWLTVVGVVENIRHRSLRSRPEPELYRPYAQEIAFIRRTSLVLRTQGDPMAVAASLRQRIHQVNPDQPVSEVKTMDVWVREAAAQPRFYTLLLEIFAGLATLLSVAGVYALVAYTVAQRSRELGIRSALGATGADLVKFVMISGLKPVLAGITAGLAAALISVRFLESQLYEIAPTDPATFVTVALLVAGCGLGAALIPARRAASVDPAVTLRAE